MTRAGPADEAVRAATLATVEAFFVALEAIDVEAFVALWAEDGVQEMPFAPAGFPNRLEGRAAIRRQYGGMPAAYASMRFPGRVVRPLLAPEWAVAEYRGEISLTGGGRYDNRYVGIFHVRGGKLVRFVEYFDPGVLAAAFGAENLAKTFSLGS